MVDVGNTSSCMRFCHNLSFRLISVEYDDVPGPGVPTGSKADPQAGPVSSVEHAGGVHNLLPIIVQY